MASGINSHHRKHFKAGGSTAPDCNLFADCGWRLTRSARNTLVQREFEDDKSAKAEARRIEDVRRAELQEKRRQERASPLPRPGFLRRCVNFLKGVA